MTYLFVGERPSPTARARGWAWRDGRLAARTLFDALRALGLDPLAQHYDNVFVDHADTACRRALRRIRRRAAGGLVVVALGQKAHQVLAAARVPHRTAVHPAARGRIRNKARYLRMLRRVLLRAR